MKRRLVGWVSVAPALSIGLDRGPRVTHRWRDGGLRVDQIHRLYLGSRATLTHPTLGILPHNVATSSSVLQLPSGNASVRLHTARVNLTHYWTILINLPRHQGA